MWLRIVTHNADTTVSNRGCGSIAHASFFLTLSCLHGYQIYGAESVQCTFLMIMINVHVWKTTKLTVVNLIQHEMIFAIAVQGP